MRRPDERGVGTVLSAGICLVLLVVAWTASVMVAWLGQVSAAQDAADLASLAAAGARAKGDDACAAAATAAVRNGSGLVACRILGDEVSFVVEVRVRNALRPSLPGGPMSVERVASAGTLQ